MRNTLDDPGAAPVAPEVETAPRKPSDARRCRRRAARRRKRRDTAAISAFVYDLRASAPRA